MTIFTTCDCFTAPPISPLVGTADTISCVPGIAQALHRCYTLPASQVVRRAARIVRARPRRAPDRAETRRALSLKRVRTEMRTTAVGSASTIHAGVPADHVHELSERSHSSALAASRRLAPAAGERRRNAGAVARADAEEGVSPAVVNIATRGTVREQRRNPLLDDPFFRRFFDVPDTRRASGSSRARAPASSSMRRTATSSPTRTSSRTPTEITVTLLDDRAAQGQGRRRGPGLRTSRC